MPLDEQFCTSCGSFMDPLRQPTEAAAPARPRRTGNVISVSSDGPVNPVPGDPGIEEFRLDEPAPPPPPPRRSGGTTVECPSCHAANPSTNLHCQSCGARLRQDPLPTAPRPAVQATAGVRAALAISGLLLIVILIALAFNIFGGDETASGSTTSTTVTSTTGTVVEPTRIDVLRVSCDPPGLGSLVCENLTKGTGSEYQVNWEELEQQEKPIKIRLDFAQPMTISRIDWTNIQDNDRFLQNYRAQGITLSADGNIVDMTYTLKDEPGTQSITWPALDANYVEITIHSAYRSEVVNGKVFTELAIDEIEIIARPSNPEG
ncbi:MAG: hypothetical protein DIU67_007125 [Actinomycetes bacterium]